ncbi:MAG: flavin reductase family protein [Nanoarchaeota archaeon]|nr:flavin reductase family protein [Nanoarchaeota archaeon]
MGKESEKIRIVPDANKKYFYNYPNNVVVVGVESNGQKNVMPVAWSTNLSYSPFLYGISVGLDRHTHKLLSDADSFTVNFVEFKYAQEIRTWGRSSGCETDKIRKFGIQISRGKKTNAPIVDLAYCTFECAKKRQVLLGDHTLFVGEVRLIYIDRKAVGLDDTLNTEQILPLLYLGIDNYITLNKNSRITLKHLPFYYKHKK